MKHPLKRMKRVFTPRLVPVDTITTTTTTMGGFIETALKTAQILLIQSAVQMKEAVHDSTQKPMIMDVYSENCGFSRMMTETFTGLKSKYGDSVTFYGANAEEHSSLASEYKIAGLPTFVGFACGHEVERVIGANKEGLEKLVLTLKDTKC